MKFKQHLIPAQGRNIYGKLDVSIAGKSAFVYENKGIDGKNGTDGQDGTPGADGKDGVDGKDGQDGQDGQNAVVFWLNVSNTEIHLDKNGSPTPETISVTGMTRAGTGTPTTATDCKIVWGYDTTTPTTEYEGPISLIGAGNYKYLNIIMYYLNTIQVASQSIAIVRDGQNGDEGRQGAAMRGPVEYTAQTTYRRFCNGTLTSEDYPEDAKFIDIIIKDGVYYYCSTSYEGDCADDWDIVQSNWTEAGDEFNFVATNILLANNAKINFASSNELYLLDPSGNVTAGAKGGNGISFWAGSSNPSDGNFQVNYNGEMTAKKGQFGCLTIGDGTQEWASDGLGGNVEGTNEDNDEYENEVFLNPTAFHLKHRWSNEEAGNTGTTDVFISADNVSTTFPPIYIAHQGYYKDRETLSIETDGTVQANNYKINYKNIGSPIIASPIGGFWADMQIILLVSTAPTVTITNDIAYVNGRKLTDQKYSWGDLTMQMITSTMVSQRNLPSWTLGHWALCGRYSVEVLTGYAHPQYVVKDPNTIYITLE